MDKAGKHSSFFVLVGCHCAHESNFGYVKIATVEADHPPSVSLIHYIRSAYRHHNNVACIPSQSPFAFARIPTDEEETRDIQMHATVCLG